MRKFISKLLFFIPLLLFLIYMEYNLGYMPNSYSFKRECLEKQLDSIEVLTLGSSQMAYGVNPSYLSLKGFNLANISQTIFYDTRLTLKYIDKMPKLKIVIITVSYFSFGEQLFDGPEAWRDYFYSQFWDINFPEINKYDLARFSKIYLYTPKVSFSYLCKNFNVNLIEGFEQNGYLWHDTISNDLNISNKSGNQRVWTHDIEYKEHRFTQNQKDIEFLIKELKQRNIESVIITLPVFSTYSQFANKEKLKRNEVAILSICAKHRCRYFNYFSDARFVKRDFYDNDHLNFIGAEKLSRIINQEIIKTIQ